VLTFREVHPVWFWLIVAAAVIAVLMVAALFMKSFPNGR
jgi:hypothetical protein